MPGTAGGTVRCKAVTVARAISSEVYFFLHSKPRHERKRERERESKRQ
jgi:hypothetical protein